MACWDLLCNRAEEGYVHHNSSPTTWPWSHHYAHLTGKDTKTQRSEINCPRVIQFLSGPRRTFQVCWTENLPPSAHCLRWGLMVTELPPTTASRLSNQLPEHTGARRGQQGINSITVESHQMSYQETQPKSQSPMFAEENSRKALSQPSWVKTRAWVYHCVGWTRQHPRESPSPRLGYEWCLSELSHTKSAFLQEEGSELPQSSPEIHPALTAKTRHPEGCQGTIFLWTKTRRVSPPSPAKGTGNLSSLPRCTSHSPQQASYKLQAQTLVCEHGEQESEKSKGPSLSTLGTPRFWWCLHFCRRQ